METLQNSLSPTSASSGNIQKLVGLRVLVTGASGFLGSHMVRRLIDERAIVAAVSRHPERMSLTQTSDLCFYRCDLTDSKTLESVFRSFRPETLIHVAAHPDGGENFQQVRDAISGNLIATVNTLEAFRACGGSVFIYADTCKVYGDSVVPYREAMGMAPISSYAITKAAGWEFCRQYSRLHGIYCISARPTMIYGPGQSFNLITFVCTSILDGAKSIQLDGGLQTRDPLYVDDAIDAFVEILRRGRALSGRVINLGGGNECAVKELALLVAHLMNSNVRIECVEKRKRPTDMQRNFCDNAEALAILGWSPRTGLRYGLMRTIESLILKRAKGMSRYG